MYGTLLGWRKIVENMYKNGSVADWYRTPGKHTIYAKGKKVDLHSCEHTLKANPVDASPVRVRTHDVPMTPPRMRASDAGTRGRRYKARQYFEEPVLEKPRRNSFESGQSARGDPEVVKGAADRG